MELILEEASSNGAHARLAEPAAFLDKLRAELDSYYSIVVQYAEMEPDQVLISVSGISGRLMEIRAHLHRSGSARAQKLRTTEIEPLLQHLDSQFRIHSRLLSARELDFRLSGGAP